MTGPLDFSIKITGLAILAGLIAGGILATIQIVLVRPLIDALSGDWLNYQTANGQFDEGLFNQQIQSIYFESLAFALFMGLGGGALLGTIFIFGGDRVRKAQLKFGLIVGIVLWFVVSVVPTVKYPPDPVATFDPNESENYSFLLAAYTAVSGAAATGSFLVFRRLSRKTKWLGAGAMYLGIMAVMTIIFPDVTHADQPFTQALVVSWRTAISIADTTFWIILGVVAGLLCKSGTAERLVQRHAGR